MNDLLFNEESKRFNDTHLYLLLHKEFIKEQTINIIELANFYHEEDMLRVKLERTLLYVHENFITGCINKVNEYLNANIRIYNNFNMDEYNCRRQIEDNRFRETTSLLCQENMNKLHMNVNKLHDNLCNGNFDIFDVLKKWI